MLPQAPTSEFPYQIERKIGEGAMGEVYRAMEPSLGRPVAIKTMLPSSLQGLSQSEQEEVLGRFIQEAQAAAALSHPGVTTIYRVGSVEGIPYIAMEWLSGPTLEAVLEDQAPLAEDVVARLGVELLEALDAAHRAGIVHRDVKPANLVLVEGGRLKVTDFGIARVQGSSLVKTQAGMIVGTPLFSSPEQFLGKPVDGRSDLFAAGVILYLALTAQYPFDGDTPMAVAHAALNTTPASPRQFNPGISPDMADIVLKALARDPGARFASAAEMAQALSALSRRGGMAELMGSRLHGTAVSAPRLKPAAAMTGTSSAYRDLSRNPARMVISVVKSWEVKHLAGENISALIEKLLERPVHAPPFTGGVIVGDIALLIGDGLLLGSVFTSTGETGDNVLEALPETGDAQLYALPAGTHPRLVVLLASQLHPPRFKHQSLDASFVNIPALVQKLEQERFHGTLVLRHKQDMGRILFLDGQQVLRLFSRGWDEVPLARPWQSWIGKLPVRVCVEHLHVRPSRRAYRHELRNHVVNLEGLEHATGVLESETLSLVTERVPFVSQEALIRSDIGASLLRWMRLDLPAYFAERKLTGAWKYLVEWVALIEKAILHHDLSRPREQTTDFFDLVTFDADEKALHLASVIPSGTREQLERFIERAIAAKTARIKSGDVGGAILVAPSYTPDALAAYAQATEIKSKGGLLSKMQKSFTGYQGFIRLGSRRGFHLLLVTLDEHHRFHPVLP